MKLTTTEKHAFVAFQLRGQELDREQREVCREIEARVGLPPGSIGATHRIDLSALCVVAVAPAPGGNGERWHDPMGDTTEAATGNGENRV